MKFTLSWLKEHLDTDASLDDIVAAMTMAGLEVEEVHDPAAALSAFTIAHVLSAEKHPDADKLRVCQVATVDGEKQIVCGAPNARASIAVAYAPLGAFIPGLDFSLDKKPRKIRGVESSGMMCSGKELELGEDHDGILELDPADYPVGQPVAEAFNKTDAVIDFEVTPNRPDWLGVRGIARDLAAAGLGTLKPDTIEPVPGTFANPQTVRIEDIDGCPTFVGRVVRGVKNGPSPQWLQDKLTAIGLRPISALVDITNYMTFDRARPLHVYDLAKVSGDIIVRRGKDESFDALDDKAYTASTDDVAICDESGILGLGGIVGGESSGVSETTTDILIECAVFDPLTIRRSAKRLGVNSDAKYRFERGIDTGFMLDGMEMATQLVLDLCGGEASEVSVAGAIPEAPASVTFDPARVEQLLGFSVPEDEMLSILSTLGFERQGSAMPWTLSVPTWRRDVTMQADIVEEIARIAGFDRLPATSLPPLPGRREPTATLTQSRTRKARRALALRGLSESVTWSFVLDDHATLFGGADGLELDNPISSDLNVMRPSALIHMVLAGQRSANQGYPGASLFELGPVYRSLDAQALTLAGMRRVESARDWAGGEEITALTAKADALAALEAMGANVDNLQLSQPTGEYWHPGRTGRLQMGPKNILADFGELHPRVLKAMGIEGRVVAFEIWPENLPAPRNKGKGKKSTSKAKGALALSDLMPVHRDFAFIVDDTVKAGDVIQAVKRADKQLIADVTLFDIYVGAGVPEGQKSLAFDVALAPTEATLTDADLEAVSAKIIKAAEKLGATLRG